MLSYIVLCHFHILSYTMYFSYTVLFHILSYCTFNCVLSSHSSAMLLISCYILYAFHLHILVIYFSPSYTILVHILSSCTLYFPYTVIYSSLSFSYTFLYYVLLTVYFHRIAVLCFSYHVIYYMHFIYIYLSYILYISFSFRFHVCIYLRSGYGK